MIVTKDILEEQSLSSQGEPYNVVSLTSGRIDQRLTKGFSSSSEDSNDSLESSYGNNQLTVILHDDPFEYFNQSNHVRSI